MDSLTHIALGACMGEAFAGHKVGKKAMIWGALAQSIPDIDFIAAFWLNTSDNLLAHRGFTHSILFSLLMTFIMTYFAERWHRPHNISFLRWWFFFAAAIFMHIFLDAFNNYGVGWFEPFSHYRFSFNVMYVADPFFSIVPGISLVVLIIMRSFKKARRFWWRIGLVSCLVYLGYCGINKLIINYEVRQLLANQQVKHKRFFTTPAPLQSWLWFVVAEADSGYHVGYRSVFDKTDRMPLYYFPRNGHLLDDIREQQQLKKLIRFSQGYYTVEQRQDTMVFNDLRFGQIIGWENPYEEFAFHYYIQPDIDNTLVVQRGRFAKWDRQTFRYFWLRVNGNEIQQLKRR
jgi:inner membrane protein